MASGRTLRPGFLQFLIMKRSKLALLPLGLALLLAACASDPLPIPQHSFGVYATASTPSAAFRTLADPQGKAEMDGWMMCQWTATPTSMKFPMNTKL